MSVVKTYLPSAFQIILVFNGNFEIGFNVWSCFFGYAENITTTSCLLLDSLIVDHEN